MENVEHEELLIVTIVNMSFNFLAMNQWVIYAYTSCGYSVQYNWVKFDPLLGHFDKITKNNTFLPQDSRN